MEKVNVMNRFPITLLIIFTYFWVSHSSAASSLTESAAVVMNYEAGEEGADNILLLYPSGDNFEEVATGIVQDIDGELGIVHLKGPTLTSDAMMKAYEKYQPKVIVAMGNRTLKAYNTFQKGLVSKPALIIVAALDAGKYVDYFENSTAIAYEIPAITGLLTYRELSKGAIETFGIIGRQQYEPYLKKNIAYTQQEKFKAKYQLLDKKPDVKSLQRALKKLKGVDILWITNDTALLTAEMITGAWAPFVKANKIPVMVGAESLLSPELKLGSFGVFPDHLGLGAQTASRIFEIIDSDYSTEDMDIEQPIVVKQYLNTSLSTARGQDLDEKQFSTLDGLLN